MPTFRKLDISELGQSSPGFQALTAKFPIVLVLDSIRSMSNVGSIFRTADAFGISAVYLCGHTGTPPHREINKTALGATETVEWKYFEDISEALELLKTNEFEIFAIEQAHPSIELQSFHPSSQQKLALVLGNEVTGVSESALEYCDGVVEIPQFGSKHSLNVAVSAGIVAWQVLASKITTPI